MKLMQIYFLLFISSGCAAFQLEQRYSCIDNKSRQGHVLKAVFSERMSLVWCAILCMKQTSPLCESINHKPDGKCQLLLGADGALIDLNATQTCACTDGKRETRVPPRAFSKLIPLFQECPRKFQERFVDGEHVSCYLVVQQRIGFYESLAACQQHKTDIVKVETKEEQIFLAKFLSTFSTENQGWTENDTYPGYWVGAYKAKLSVHWKWWGVTGMMTYENWMEGHPTEKGKFAILSMTNEFKWASVSEDTTGIGCICELRG